MQADWARAAAGGFPSAEAFAQAQPPGACPIPRVYCSWNQTATATGRLSSSAPNLQARGDHGGQACSDWRVGAAACCPGPSSPHLRLFAVRQQGVFLRCVYVVPSCAPTLPAGRLATHGCGALARRAPRPANLKSPRSCLPAPQAVTKYNLEAAGNEGLINIRDAFVAPPSCLLIAADYSQVGAEAGWQGGAGRRSVGPWSCFSKQTAWWLDGGTLW